VNDTKEYWWQSTPHHQTLFQNREWNTLHKSLWFVWFGQHLNAANCQQACLHKNVGWPSVAIVTVHSDSATTRNLLCFQEEQQRSVYKALQVPFHATAFFASKNDQTKFQRYRSCCKDIVIDIVMNGHTFLGLSDQTQTLPQRFHNRTCLSTCKWSVSRFMVLGIWVRTQVLQRHTNVWSPIDHQFPNLTEKIFQLKVFGYAVWKPGCKKSAPIVLRCSEKRFSTNLVMSEVCHNSS
jgi:hypothetical protein